VPPLEVHRVVSGERVGLRDQRVERRAWPLTAASALTASHRGRRGLALLS
jgi:hypothetical protein